MTPIVNSLKGVLLYNTKYISLSFWLLFSGAKMKQNKGGQGLVEYALIMLLVALAVIVILALLGPTIGSLFSNIIPLI